MEVDTMNRETKINILIVALAELIAQGRTEEEKYKFAPQITFLSKSEVQFKEFPGKQRPTNRVFENNPLLPLLKQVVDYYIDDEQKHYQECLFEEAPEAAEAFEEGIYNSEVIPGHIYHIIRFCQELTNDSQ
ncbi:MAG: hypothetical protein LBT43_05035 [Prevotella sp.]|jgi:hypothetical protein|nr:hypothetical protein [Prevotella sp.]